jgi:hypothetical protein
MTIFDKKIARLTATEYPEAHHFGHIKNFGFALSGITVA